MGADLLCFSHLRWDFVYQRPNHLMSRATRDHRVAFIEEPLLTAGVRPHLRSVLREGLTVVTPMLPVGLDDELASEVLQGLLDDWLAEQRIERPILWYYTPMFLPWTRQIAAETIVYDSMDFLAGFRGAPDRLVAREEELLQRADLVFTGGLSLQQRMQRLRPDCHCFPSSVDVAHFARARSHVGDPPDQADIARPRIGYAGVIDERLDLGLIDNVAQARPDLQVVLVGPTAKIAPDEVPSRPNVHQLGLKRYDELPAYLSGWDIAWMPFAHNESTRFISPTKTPEYLAAGLPVVSTSIHDVVDPYGREGLVRIADGLAETLAAIDDSLAGSASPRAHADAFLAGRSWDVTWAAMAALLAERASRIAVAVPPPAGGVAAPAGVAVDRATVERPVRIGAPAEVGAGRPEA